MTSKKYQDGEEGKRGERGSLSNVQIAGGQAAPSVLLSSELSLLGAP